jgi:hypothetical protein
MSAIGFMSSSVLESLLSRTTQNSAQKFKQGFQQLGQDLQSGNVSQAATDLASLQLGAGTSQSSSGSLPGTSSSSVSSSSASSVTQSFNQIAQDLKSGNLTAAQSDYVTLQQNLQQGHQMHSHRGGLSGAATELQQELSQLGQSLQSGNLSGAQQAYASLQTDLSAFGVGSSASSTGSSSGAALNLSV